MKLVRLLFVLPLLDGLAFAQPRPPQQLTFTPHHARGIYEVGETVGWTVRLGPVTPTYAYKWTARRNNAVVVKEGKLVYVAVEPYAGLSHSETPSAYVGVNTGRNNDAFWSDKLAAPAKIPMNAALTPVPTDVPNVEMNMFVLDALGSKAHGYVAKPAREGRFPAVIQLRYAGVYALNARAVAQPAAEGRLILNVDSHDKVPSDPAGNIPRNYQTVGATDREKSYFLNMYLRDWRVFIDTTSPPARVWTALNQISGPKEPLPMIESEHDNLTPQKGRACPARSREIPDILVKGGAYQPSGADR